MTRRRGSIALMAIFIFAIISLLSLVIFSRIEDNLLLIRTEKDEKQASYYAESLAYLANEGINKELIARVVQDGTTEQLPAVSFDDVEDKKPMLLPVMEKGTYTALKLETACTYKGISGKATLKFNGVNPLFNQQDGVLSVEEMKDAGVYDNWQSLLEENFIKPSKDGTRLLHTEGPLHLKQKDGRILQVAPDGTESPFLDNMRNLRWEMAGALETESPLEMVGVLWLKKGASVKGNIHLSGVLIREPGSTVEGQIIVDGLLIGEKNGPIKANFQPRSAELHFCFFDDFIEPSGYRLKKLY